MNVFISYAHHDEAACGELRLALAPLTRVFPDATVWHDGKIMPGQYWGPEIVAALDAADLILLLISDAFFASDFCWKKEMPRALARHKAGVAVVVPIIVDFVGKAWQVSDFAKLQALPAGAKPIPDWSPPKRGWVDVADRLQDLLVEKGLVTLPAAEDPFAVPFDPARGIFHIPRAENPFFTGRDEALAWIGRTLNQGNRNRARPVALLHGTGGVGKSETAAQFAHVHRDAYQVVWWIEAETIGGRDEGFRQLADRLGLSGVDRRDPSAVRGAVKDWLAGNGGWLLLFDDAESPDDLRDWLPLRAGGHLLITSRNPAWRKIADELPVTAWDIPTAAAYMIDRTGDENSAAAADLAAELGGLPLACEHAAAYAETAGIGLGEYLQRLRRDFGQAAGPVKRTFQMAMQAAALESPLAAPLMDLCARFAAESIPRSAFKGDEAAKALGGADDFAIDDALAALRKRGLAQGRDEIIIHRLVRETARQDKTPDAAKALDLAALRLVTAAFPQDDRPTDARNWADCAALRPHAETLLTAVADSDAPPGTVDLLCNQLGMYLKERGDYPFALRLYERSLKLSEEHFGPIHGETATALSNLALLFKDMGRLDEAEAHARRALTIDEGNLDPDHPNVAISLSNLATILNGRRFWGGAAELLRRALTIDEAAHGPDHPNVAVTLSNFASALWGQGRHEEAKPLLERALQIDRKEYGDDHPTMAYRYNNLGATLLAMDDPVGAAAHASKALAIREKWLGPDHPLTRQTRRNLEFAEAAAERRAKTAR